MTLPLLAAHELAGHGAFALHRGSQRVKISRDADGGFSVEDGLPITGDVEAMLAGLVAGIAAERILQEGSAEAAAQLIEVLPVDAWLRTTWGHADAALIGPMLSREMLRSLFKVVAPVVETALLHMSDILPAIDARLEDMLPGESLTFRRKIN